MENNEIKISEKKVQAKIWKLIDNKYPQFRDKVWHTANELYVEKRENETEQAYQKRYMIILSQLKAIGVVSGVPDILIMYKGILYWIELKVKGGKILDAQKKIQQSWKMDGSTGIVIWENHEEEAIKFCNWILNNGLKIDRSNFIPYA